MQLQAKVHHIYEDDLLDKTTYGRRPNAKAFAKAKSTEKGSLIINMVPWNEQ